MKNEKEADVMTNLQRRYMAAHAAITAMVMKSATTARFLTCLVGESLVMVVEVKVVVLKLLTSPCM